MKGPAGQGGIRLGIALAVLVAMPASVFAASETREREASGARYSLGEGALEVQGNLSASGRFRLDAQVSVRADGDPSAISGRYDASAKLVAVADCSGYVFANGFE